MCIGALDGKRVLISKPPHSGSEYYDYKGHFTLIMMALVDANYKFMCVNVVDDQVMLECGKDVV